MESMTGYGRGAAEGPNLRVSVEIRGVNQKGLDLHFRLPAPLLRHDLACREKIRQRIARGRADLSATLEYTGQTAVEFRVAEGVASAAGRICAALESQGVLARGLTLSDLLNLPDAVTVCLAEEAEGEAFQLLCQGLDTALDAFCETRRAEGARLKGQFVQGASALKAQIEQMRPLLAGEVTTLRDKLRQRIADLAVGMDPSRLEQEVALLAQKGDITEEVQRLVSHLEAFDYLLASESGDLGKRLDHLLQEIQREISTLLAKSSSLELTRCGMAMRLTAEQLREQSQNVA